MNSHKVTEIMIYICISCVIAQIYSINDTISTCVFNVVEILLSTRSKYTRRAQTTKIVHFVFTFEVQTDNRKNKYRSKI